MKKGNCLENLQEDCQVILQGKIIIDKTKGCLIKSEERLVVGIGIDGFIVIDTSDVLLIANKKN